MSAVDNGRNNTQIRQRTLQEIIKDDRSTKDKKSWKTFRDKLRLKRAGSAWTSSVRIPASDVNVQSSISRSFRRASEDGDDNAPIVNSKMNLARRDSLRFGKNRTQTDQEDSVDASLPSDVPPSRSFKPQIIRHASIRLGSANANEADRVDDSDDSDDDYDNSPEADDSPRSRPVPKLAEERSLSAREAVASQEAAEAVAAADQAASTGDEPAKMSLMDLLGETGYAMGEDDDEYDEEEEEEKDVAVAASGGGMECTCCVCMVKHKGSAIIPCGHTFCRLCSRELTFQRGICPLCNGYILEILDIF